MGTMMRQLLPQRQPHPQHPFYAPADIASPKTIDTSTWVGPCRAMAGTPISFRATPNASCALIVPPIGCNTLARPCGKAKINFKMALSVGMGPCTEFPNAVVVSSKFGPGDEVVNH